MRQFNKRQRLEMISMISGDKDSIALGHLMCQNYISQQPNDSKFRQKYYSFLKKHNKILRKRLLTSRKIWAGITTANHLSSMSGIQTNNPIKFKTLINTLKKINKYE